MRASYVVQLVSGRYSYLTPEQIVSRLYHSSFVDLEKRYLYYGVAKAACTSMKTLLKRLAGDPPIKLICGGHDESRRDMFIHARENVPLPSLVDLDDASQREILHAPDFLRMTVVRNPYTRVLSAWRKVMLCEPGCEPQYMAIKGKLPDFGRKDLITLPEFITYLEGEDLRTCDSHWSFQTTHMFLDAIDFNFVGKVESMGEVMDRFSRHLGHPDMLAAERKNVSEGSSTGRYDAELARRVHALYSIDFQRLGYEAGDWIAGDPAASRPVSDQKFCDEIIERNLLLSELYREVYRLRTDMERANRLHVPKLMNALTSTRAALRKAIG
jgi:Sulfotransferase family